MTSTTTFIIIVSSLTLIFILLDSGFLKKLFTKSEIISENNTDYKKVIENTDLLRVCDCKQKNTGNHYKESIYIEKAKTYTEHFQKVQGMAMELFK